MRTLLLASALLISQFAQAEKVMPLIQKNLTDIPGKHGLMATVDIPPGQAVPKHRHNANVFAYVLSGSIVTQLEGQAPETFHTGQSFFEGPADIHLASRNPSTKEHTRLLVVMIKDKGAPPTIYLAPHKEDH